MPEKGVTIFGDYIGPDEGEIKGRLTLSFQSDTLDMDDLWENSSLSAKFLSTFWGNFFPKRDPESARTRREMQDEILYISVELLGNAVKFTNEPDFMAEICLYLHENELRFYVSNSVNPDDLEKFQAFIKRILTEDTSEIFLEQMEKSVSDDCNESGVGYLTLINDYGINLAWKFEGNESGTQIVTTLARLPVVRKKQSNGKV
ncbi:MAG: ATP-binding protein [Desulfobacterales bacterium]|nr:ATP-binding protein [Desulfobacterales bacterium]